MPRSLKALCWALAIVLIAFGNVWRLVDDATAQTLFIVFPILALMALRGESACYIGNSKIAA
jgi:hypothetical protein